MIWHLLFQNLDCILPQSWLNKFTISYKPCGIDRQKLYLGTNLYVYNLAITRGVGIALLIE